MTRHFGCWVVVAVFTIIACGSKSDPAPKPTPGSDVTPPPPKDTPVAAQTPDAGKKAPPPLAIDPGPKVQAALPIIRKMAADPVVAKFIVEQNKKKMTQAEIDKIDKEWMASTGVTPLMKPYIENKCAEALKKYLTELPAIVEAFAMDDKGGLVCTIYRTTDYWQGDEAKWQKSFTPNAEFIDKATFDESSQTYSIQVSMPVTEKGKPIGAITVGLGLDKL
jgi:hypothetical protein